MTEALSVEAIRRGLRTTSVGRHLYLFGEVESTNEVLRRLARSGAAEGTVVLAEGQSHGRGRLGQPWFSPTGVNLYVSALFRSAIKPHEASVFSFITSLALADAIKELGLTPAIKWPNDVLVERKKVAGCLMECALRGEAVDFIVLGAGVNVNVDLGLLHEVLGRAGQAATSLAAVAGHEVDRNALAAAFLNHLDAWARRYHSDGPAAVLAAWRERDILAGRRVEIRGSDPAFEGRALGIGDDGHLVVQDSKGGRHTILTEEIRVLD
ncbi:MAG TPA: biotin--[acetyl-CoA-carboxylase] ligase [Methylomirabilota bacterium]|nr:biotin--[acetyl-CoA-carboxylase] ligase [Methylomirabilota bacterium]